MESQSKVRSGDTITAAVEQVTNGAHANMIKVVMRTGVVAESSSSTQTYNIKREMQWQARKWAITVLQSSIETGAKRELLRFALAIRCGSVEKAIQETSLLQVPVYQSVSLSSQRSSLKQLPVMSHWHAIEDAVMVATSATVLVGARVGRGFMIGAGAMVMEGTQISPHSICFGVPSCLHEWPRHVTTRLDRLGSADVRGVWPPLQC